MFSTRNIVPNLLARCLIYEFENILRQIDSVDLLAPKPMKIFKYGDRIANRVAHASSFSLNPGISKIKVDREYDLFFFYCEFAKDLFFINALKGWEKKCKTSVCWIDEILLNQMFNLNCFAKLISKFDHVVLSSKQGMDIVRKAIRGTCLFQPPGVDALLFCPYPNPPTRFIDVLSIGRRSTVTHEILLNLTRKGKIFYHYDTITGELTNNPEQHRFLLANLAKRSRYFLVYPGLIDEPKATGNEQLVGARYFEGAASGSLMIGEAPKNKEFSICFQSSDVVIELPYNSPDIGILMDEIDKQYKRQEEIRRSNILDSLRHHDWVYRWEAVLNLAGLNPLPSMLERQSRLRNISQIVQNEIKK